MANRRRVPAVDAKLNGELFNSVSGSIPQEMYPIFESCFVGHLANKVSAEVWNQALECALQSMEAFKVDDVIFPTAQPNGLVH